MVGIVSFLCLWTLTKKKNWQKMMNCDVVNNTNVSDNRCGVNKCVNFNQSDISKLNVASIGSALLSLIALVYLSKVIYNAMLEDSGLSFAAVG